MWPSIPCPQSVRWLPRSGPHAVLLLSKALCMLYPSLRGFHFGLHLQLVAGDPGR